MNAKKGSWALIGSAVIVTVAMIWQWREKSLLGIEYAHERAVAERLVRTRASQKPPTGQLSAFQDTASAAAASESVSRAKAELVSLREQVEAAEAERFAVGKVMRADTWRNVGGETVKAALETVLWAGAGGDVNALASMFGFIPGERAPKSAQALLEKLPAGLRAQYDSPERLIAFLTIKDIPLGSVEVRQFTELSEGWPFPAAQVRVLLTAADGKQKDASLLFVNPGSGWKLLVTDPVIAHYAPQFAPVELGK